MDSGIAPLLLDKNQLAYAGNITVRDGFATCRPPFTKNLTLVYPNDEVREAVEQGLFQGCLQVPYQPDSGAPSQVAQIGGRLFQFQIVGDVITVTEITIPGDPNPATSTQAWLWQSENFVIVNDGISLPIFWDGATSRRSYGPSVVLGTVIAPAIAVPEIGSQATINISSYTGPYNVPVLIGGEYYQPIENAAGYLISAVNIGDTPGNPIPVGTEVVAKPSVAFVNTTAISPSGSYGIATAFNIPITAPFTGALYTQIVLFGKIWWIQAIGPGNLVQVGALQAGTYSPLAAFTQVPISGSTAPNLVYGTVAVAASAPAVSGTAQFTLNSVYTGPAAQVLFIGNAQYAVTAVPPSTPSGTSLTVINLTAATGGNIGGASLPVDILSVPELPAGRMGTYGKGQNWISLVDGTSFLPSDIVGGPSGTPAYQYRDAVLKTTIVSFRSGNFRIPVAGDTITSMSFPAVMDQSLGQGALQIGTQRSFFSCIAPIDDTVLASLAGNSPILTESLKGKGPQGQNSTINNNSDTLFRSSVGLGSLILGRREFTQSISGNTPISEEMVRVLNKDNKRLLPYSSAINFDNRVIYTASPQESSQGVFHSGLVVMNLDSISSLREKAPPVYDGLWTGINVLQLSAGSIAGVERAFAFTFNVPQSKIELYELLPTGDQHFDNGGTPITWAFETAALFQDVKPPNVMLQLSGGEFAVDEVIGTVRFQVFFKPDQFGAYGAESCWVPWWDFSVCARADSKPLYYPRLGLPEPSSDLVIPQLDLPARNAYTFQFRFVITGQCRFLRAMFSAVTCPIPKFQPPLAPTTPT